MKIRLSGRKSLLLIFLLLSFLLLIFFGVLIYMKKININQFWVKQYSIHGIDVSHHQGEIDWKKLKEEKVQFAYIKATEGSGHVDDQFEDNRKQAQAVGIHTEPIIFSVLRVLRRRRQKFIWRRSEIWSDR